MGYGSGSSWKTTQRAFRRSPFKATNFFPSRSFSFSLRLVVPFERERNLEKDRGDLIRPKKRHTGWDGGGNDEKQCGVRETICARLSNTALFF